MKKYLLFLAFGFYMSICKAQLPVTDFSVYDSTVCPGTCTNFTNLSTNATSYHWTFAGGNPSTSTASDPQNICYNAPGIYSVTLIATNANGSDTLTINNFIRIYPFPPGLGVTVHGDTLFATQGFVHYQWYHNFVPVPGDTLLWHVAIPDGTHSPVATDSNGCEVEAVSFGGVLYPDFVPSDTEFCAGSCISFTNLSTPDTTQASHQWHFYGANPSVSLDNNPQNICYSTAGSFQVKLVMVSSLISRSDSFMVNVIPCTGISEVPASDLPFTISPNPFDDLVTLHFKERQNAKCVLEIFNSIGEKLLEKKIISEGLSLDLSALTQGIYFVSVKTEKGIFIEKIVK